MQYANHFFRSQENGVAQDASCNEPDIIQGDSAQESGCIKDQVPQRARDKISFPFF
jgi:hypothetical protein